MASVDLSHYAIVEGPMCGLRRDGIVVCLGLEYNPPKGAEPRVPTAQFTSISVGQFFACGIKTDDAVACWPTRHLYYAGSELPVPEGRFESVSVGGNHACGIRPDASVECWLAREGSDDSAGQATPPQGKFRSVSAGEFHTCGVRTDDTLECWGDTRRKSWPSGAFTSVSAGFGYNCALRTEGSIACWSLNQDTGSDDFQITPPPGRDFTSVSTGLIQTCATDVDGDTTCWGLDSLGLSGSTLPAIGMRMSSGGFHYTCGVRIGVFDLCWDEEREIAGPKAVSVSLNHDEYGHGQRCIITAEAKL